MVPMDKAQNDVPVTHFVWMEQWPEGRMKTYSCIEGIV